MVQWVAKNGESLTDVLFPMVFNQIYAAVTGQTIDWNGFISGNCVSAYYIDNSKITMYGEYAMVIGT